MESFSRNAIKDAIYPSIRRIYDAQHSDLNIYRNTLDGFSGMIDALVQDISMDEWLEQERNRQIQKTKQNAIGSLHEEIMGSIDGVENLEVGNVFDIRCDDLRLIAEVKNKHNTTKGNHKVNIYRDLEDALDSREYHGFTAYYVEVLPKNGQRYNKPFTPPDNVSGGNMPRRDDIRVIDGYSFYALLTDSPDALEELYDELPYIVAEILSEISGDDVDPDLVIESDAFNNIFTRTFG
ncbi:TPA: Eco47II family restriction endonuclease [Vibrio parahaemolyticus]